MHLSIDKRYTYVYEKKYRALLKFNVMTGHIVM